MSEQEIRTVDAYIAQFPPERAALLAQMREVIRRAAPRAEERIRWAMPTYWQGENLVHFANAKHHIGFYPSPEAIVAFADELAAYKTTKGGVQLPASRPLPLELVERMTRYRVQAVEQKAEQD